MRHGLRSDLITQNLLYTNNDNELFFDRELSWLSFNERVIKTSTNKNIPLAERLRFLIISAYNLDEFYMVRVAGLLQLLSRKYKTVPYTGKRIDELMTAILLTTENLKTSQSECLKEIINEFKTQDILIFNKNKFTKKDNLWLKKYYVENILPLLVPTTLDQNHPFPFIHNQEKGIFFEMKDEKGNEINSVILLSKNIERFIRLPGEKLKFVLVENLITQFFEMIYPRYKLKKYGLFRVLRDSEIEIDDEAEDLIGQFETALRTRKRGEVVFLEISKSLSNSSEKLFIKEFNLNSFKIYKTEEFIDFADFSELLKHFNKSYFYKAFVPRFPQRIYDFNGDCFSAIKNKDIIVHHPFESFDVVVSFLNQAAIDSNVLNIRQTLYRTTPASPIVEALIKAAELGKSVIAVIELKARFDEENNVQLARNLEKSGVQVAYGIVDLKVHCKLTLVTRRENKKLVSYAHYGTGNYHPTTAKVYTDFSFFTSDKDFCHDARKVFNFLTSHLQPKSLKKIIISPNDSFEWLNKKIDLEIEAEIKGKPSGIWLKCNAIVDQKLIEKFYEASKAGVKVFLIVRGICCLRPNVKNLSENITVRSIIGRYLEHGRFYVFANGGKFQSTRNEVFMSSADIMPRNLYTRVEAFVPLQNPTVRSQILIQVLPALINDVQNSWQLNEKGQYIKLSNEKKFCSHSYFMENPSLSGLGSLSQSIG